MIGGQGGLTKTVITKQRLEASTRASYEYAEGVLGARHSMSAGRKLAEEGKSSRALQASCVSDLGSHFNN